MVALKQIAHIENNLLTKFGTPFQSNVVSEMQGIIIFEEAYRDKASLKGIEEFSHIWLIWGFSKNKRETWKPTVRPPRLGGNVRKGVFATRSPFRPNPIGLSSVRIERIEEHPIYGMVIHTLGADLVNGTPIYDIKPYIAFTDCHPEALEGFSQDLISRHLEVKMGENCHGHLSNKEQAILHDILACDPRPQYHDDPERIYGMEYGNLDIRFKVKDGILTVIEVLLVEGISPTV